jgi:signal transduction histidine kinase
VLEYIIQNEKERESKTTQQRRIFLRYVFHGRSAHAAFVASHTRAELRVPLNVIVLSIDDLLATGCVSEPGVSTMCTLKSCAGTTSPSSMCSEVSCSSAIMTSTLNDVLSFAAIEEGQVHTLGCLARG